MHLRSWSSLNVPPRTGTGRPIWFQSVSIDVSFMCSSLHTPRCLDLFLSLNKRRNPLLCCELFPVKHPRAEKAPLMSQWLCVVWICSPSSLASRLVNQSSYRFSFQHHSPLFTPHPSREPMRCSPSLEKNLRHATPACRMRFRQRVVRPRPLRRRALPSAPHRSDRIPSWIHFFCAAYRLHHSLASFS